MSRMYRYLLPIFALSCAVPSLAEEKPKAGITSGTIAALKHLQSLDQRMNAIGFRLVTANEPFCKTKSPRAGLMLHAIGQYGDQAAARLALDFDGPIAINAVAPDSPAAKANLTPGNGMLAINGLAISDITIDDASLREEKPAYRRLAAVNAAMVAALGLGPTQLTISTGIQKQIVSILPVQACASQFQIEVSNDRKASANGKMVSISSQLADYFLSDDEFAAVVAHELAHNVLRHKARLNAQKVNRGFFGQFGKSASRIKQTEIEADRLSIWLMANAGYDPQAAIRFWTRYGKEHGKGIFSASTHYRWKKRVKLFEEEIAKMKTAEIVDGKISPPLLAMPAQ